LSDQGLRGLPSDDSDSDDSHGVISRFPRSTPADTPSRKEQRSDRRAITGVVNEGSDGSTCTERWIPKALKGILWEKDSYDPSITKEG